MNIQPYKYRDVKEVFSEVKTAVAGIEELPTLLQLLIERYKR